MSSLLSVFSGLLATGQTWPAGWEWLDPVLEVLQTVLWPILIIVCAIGAIWAVWLGVSLAKAETKEAREEAKKKIINMVVALVCIIALILLLQLFATQLPNWIKTSPVPIE